MEPHIGLTDIREFELSIIGQSLDVEKYILEKTVMLCRVYL